MCSDRYTIGLRPLRELLVATSNPYVSWIVLRSRTLIAGAVGFLCVRSRIASIWSHFLAHPLAANPPHPHSTIRRANPGRDEHAKERARAHCS